MIKQINDLLVPNLTHIKGRSRAHRNITGDITFCVLARMSFSCGTFPFSMIFLFFKIFTTFQGLEISHSNSMTFPSFL